MQKLIELIKMNNIRIIAIDGRCASGKTTLTKELQTQLNAEVIHLDDFFLSINQKTKERLNEIGGNIDYERFLSEVLVNLNTNNPFSYYKFDCSIQTLSTKFNVENNRIIIIEGSYAHHPKFVKYYDLKVFVTVDSTEQIERLSIRNPQLLNRFIDEWIPLEERYFNELKILENADYIINTTNI